MSDEKKKVEGWSPWVNREWVNLHTTPEEALAEMLELEKEYEAPEASLPETITIYGFARMWVGREPDAKDILQDILFNLDEEDGSPDGETIPSEALKAAAEAFTKVLLQEYKPYWLEDVEVRQMARPKKEAA
jgi:hypothetical protein